MADKRTILQIEEAFSDYQCPICTLVETMNDNHIRILLYESVNDRSLRKRFMKEEGFCKRHAGKALEAGSPLNQAILYDALLEDILKRLEKDKPLHTQTPCLFCEKEKDNEAYLVGAFKDGLELTDFTEAYKSNGILCATHLEKVLALLKRDRMKRETLKTVTKEKYAKLSEVLKSIKSKHDYRNKNEAWSDAERILWKRVVHLVRQNDDDRQ